jgi:hypothetical protein
MDGFYSFIGKGYGPLKDFKKQGNFLWYDKVFLEGVE